MTRHSPRNLSSLEALLYNYVTNPTALLPNPLDTLDMESVYWTATHGPRSAEQAEDILHTPRLREMLIQLWGQEPPSDALRQKLSSTPHGQSLLAIALADDGSVSPEDRLTSETLSEFYTDLEFFLVVSDTSLEVARGALEPERGPTVWTFDSAEGLYLQVSRDADELVIEISDTAALTESGVRRWQLTITAYGQDAALGTHTEPPHELTGGPHQWRIVTSIKPPRMRIVLRPAPGRGSPSANDQA